ncbi:MAG: hypothetical protein AAB225_28040 [Acidobacteriota bacterium]
MRLVEQTFKSRLQKTDWDATTGAAGTFRFDSLPAGRYVFCARVPNSAWLSPCEWGLPSPAVSLSNASPTANATIVMKRGVPLRIRVDDAGQLLSRHEGKTPGARLLVGIGSAGYVFRLAPVVSEDSAGRNHQVVIPFDTPLKLVVRSSFFRVNDANALPLARTAATVIPFTVPSGQQVAPIRFTVTGTEQ